MLEKIFAPVENLVDEIKFDVKKKLKLFDPVMIYPYRGYATRDTVYLTGRVLERERVVHGDEQENTLLQNLHRFYKRYESDEIPGVEVECNFEGKSYTATTDEEGYYNFKIPHKNDSNEFWKEAHFEIKSLPFEMEQEKITATGEVMLPKRDSEFGVISDVDDTILQSHITSIWMKLKTVATKHVSERVAFPGVASLYRGLVQEAENAYQNPIWFVSGSSWNLYDLLEQFCREKEIPKAPFLLRELSIDAKKFIKKDTMSYKLGHIIPLMKKTDPLPMILIGDSGQKDPEIYQKVAEEFPGRVKAIYIRDVTPDKRDKEVRAIAEKLDEMGVPMILAEQSLEAARHAHKNKWILDSDLERVKQEIKENQ